MCAKKTSNKAPGKRRPTDGQQKPAPNTRLAAQTRKILGKHYASKYRTGGR